MLVSLVRRVARAHRVIAWLILATTIGSCDDPTAPLPREGPPDELRFVYGGFFSDLVTVEAQGTTLAMWRRAWDWHPGMAIDTVRTVPTAEAWRQFWVVADQAGVRRWRSSYAAEGVADGSGWSLRLVAGEFSVESTGANAYPDWQGREHELHMTEEFAALMRALGDLLGEQL